MTIFTFAMQHHMVWIGLGLPPGNNSSKGSINDLNRMGGWIGTMAQSNSDESSEVTPPLSDLKTAESLGRRIAAAMISWKPDDLLNS